MGEAVLRELRDGFVVGPVAHRHGLDRPRRAEERDPDRAEGADRDHAMSKGREGRLMVYGAVGSRSAAIFDVDNDGDDDMIVQIGDTMWSFDEDATEAELLGALFNGTLIRGVDDICIVGD